MNPFQDVTLTYLGKDYVVPADKVMGLIHAVERVATIEELYENRTGGIRRAQVSEAFAAALRYAGCRVSSAEIYTQMFGTDGLMSAVAAVNALMSMMIPPEHLRSPVNEADQPDADDSEAVEKGPPGAKKKR